MSLDKILSIGGKPGLFKLLTQTRAGFVAESLLDGKRITVGMRSNVSLLSEIAVYTYTEEIRLAEVLKAIATKENDGPAISHKEDDTKLKAFNVKYFFYNSQNIRFVQSNTPKSHCDMCFIPGKSYNKVNFLKYML